MCEKVQFNISPSCVHFYEFLAEGELSNREIVLEIEICRIESLIEEEEFLDSQKLNVLTFDQLIQKADQNKSLGDKSFTKGSYEESWTYYSKCLAILNANSKFDKLQMFEGSFEGMRPLTSLNDLSENLRNLACF